MTCMNLGVAVGEIIHYMPLYHGLHGWSHARSRTRDVSPFFARRWCQFHPIGPHQPWFCRISLLTIFLTCVLSRCRECTANHHPCGHMPPGLVGVDIFFTISGFVSRQADPLWQGCLEQPKRWSWLLRNSCGTNKLLPFCVLSCTKSCPKVSFIFFTKFKAFDQAKNRRRVWVGECKF